MRRKKHTAEEIVAKLRQVDVLVSQGRKVAEAIRSIEVTVVCGKETLPCRALLYSTQSRLILTAASGGGGASASRTDGAAVAAR